MDFFFFPANGAHYWIILFAALISIVAYFVFTPMSDMPIIWVTIVLFVDIMLFIYTFVVGLVAGLSR